MPEPEQKKLCKLIIPLLLVIFSALLLLLFRVPVLEATAEWLVVGRQPDNKEKFDIVVPLGGSDSRKLLALEIFSKDKAENIAVIFNEFEEYGTPFYKTGKVPDIAVKYLVEKLKVDKNKIYVFRSLSSTYEEAVAIYNLVKQKNWQTIAIVDSSFHSRRSRWIFNKVFAKDRDKLTFIPVPLQKEKMAIKRWWHRERELITVVNEYQKFIFYIWKYRNAGPTDKLLPSQTAIDLN